MNMLEKYFIILTKRNVVLFIISSMFLSVSSAFFSWLFPIILAKIGSTISVGIAYTVAYAISIPLSLLSGLLADNYGRKVMIIVSTLLVMVAYGVIILHLSAVTLLVAIIILEISSILSMPAMNSLIAESVESTLRGYAFTIVNFIPYISLAVGSFVLGTIVVQKNFQTVILLTFLLSFLSLLIRLGFNETFIIKYEKSTKVRISSEISKSFKNFNNIKKLQSLGIPYIYLSIMAILGVAASTLYSIYIPIYMNFELSLSESEIGVIYTISNIISFTMILMGLLVSIFGALRSLQLALLFMAVPTMLLTFLSPGSLIMVLLLVSISTLASILSQISSNTFIANFTTEDIRSTVFSSLISLSLLVSLIVPSLGAIIFSLNKRIIPLLIGTLYILSFIFSIFLNKYLMTKHENSKSLFKN
jgi:MFS family permease